MSDVNNTQENTVSDDTTAAPEVEVTEGTVVETAAGTAPSGNEREARRGSRDRGPRNLVLVVIEQSPAPRRGRAQGVDQRGAILLLEFDTAFVEAGETVSFGHDRLLLADDRRSMATLQRSESRRIIDLADRDGQRRTQRQCHQIRPGIG